MLDPVSDWQNEAWADLANMSFDLKSTTLPAQDGPVKMDEDDEDVLLLQLDLSAFDNPVMGL